MKLLFITLCALMLWAAHGSQYNIFKWKVLNFTFPNEAAREYAERNGYLKPTNAIPFDVQPHFDKKGFRTFITVPRFRPGIPYTLATIYNSNDTHTVYLKPYTTHFPQYSFQGRNCYAITSAIRTAIDECNRLWVIDSGIEVSEEYCPPKLLLFDLNMDKIIRRFYFNKSLYASRASFFSNLIVHVRDLPPSGGRCKHTMVYVSDSGYGGIVVYDYFKNTAWRIENISMYPEPTHAMLSVAGDRFVSMDGIFGMAADKEFLYFHSLASLSEYTVSRKVLDNSTLFENNKRNMHELFIPLGNRSSACAASAMDSKNNLYCVTLDPIELIKWNVFTLYEEKNFVRLPINSSELEFVSSMKIVRSPASSEDIWMLSNRYQKIAAGTQNITELNYRIVIYIT